ncbi:endonuclease/exonuclease/phosphatase family protein [Pedobacter endophyticus]|uniref:Endonuclease/exonuclease/phosphatase family protein n=2 Tax=Pedobacter endophyticus TaxID=2789740 RepID=A0A7S9Q1I3_9SPHI|nr:endonuclease/exonuclease/phosphatase family protein [Pedobacter endophyticus]
MGCGIFLIGVTLLSLLNTSHWYLAVLGFPRLAILIALVTCGVLCLLLSAKKQVSYFIFTACLLVSVCLQVWIILPYTSLSQKKVKSVDADQVSRQSSISMLIANVLMSNRNTKGLLEQINSREPDMVLAMEVNSRWVNDLRVLDKSYPYQILFPTDNTYGMSLYSKLPLTSSKVLFLNNKKVPSFQCMVRLRNGKTFQLLTVHPVAPKPSLHPDNMGEKENGLLKAAYLVAREKIPTVVAGDFNDVGWSYTTSNFSDISNLNDVRCGRGLYNTFSAHTFIFKWPLDYIYVSDEFKVVNLQRLSAFGSDHYPFYAQLAFLP